MYKTQKKEEGRAGRIDTGSVRRHNAGAHVRGSRVAGGLAGRLGADRCSCATFLDAAERRSLGVFATMGFDDGGLADEAANPCITCGACCAFFRASFYWSEADPACGGTVPAELTEKLNDFRRVMRGTSGKNPRCIALLGTIGQAVRCSIYELRSSVCHDFPPSWEQGVHHDRCDKARVAWGLEPLVRPADEPEERPEETTHPDRRAPQAA